MLIHFIELVVLHEEAQNYARRRNTDSDGKNPSHGLLIRLIDRDSGGAFHWPACCCKSDVSIYRGRLTFGLGRQVQCELLWDTVRPDGS